MVVLKKRRLVGDVKRCAAALVLVLSALVVSLVLIPGTGCSRPSQFTADDAANSAGQNKVPFQNNAGNGNTAADSGSGDGKAGAAASRDTISAPFQNLTSVAELPAGSLITVRLEKQISSDRVGDEATFTAVVDEPVLVEGKVAIPESAMVTGAVEATGSSDSGPGRGYLRLSLDSITIAGKRLPVRTSSLFVRGGAGEILGSGSGQDDMGRSGATVTRLQKGRRLTFRVAAPMPLQRQETSGREQSHFPSAP